MISRSNDDDDLREYDVSCAVRLAMGPDPIAILAGHQGLSWKKGSPLQENLLILEHGKRGGFILVAIYGVHQRALCSAACALAKMPTQ